jgi:hypothetical protein
MVAKEKKVVFLDCDLQVLGTGWAPLSNALLERLTYSQYISKIENLSRPTKMHHLMNF